MEPEISHRCKLCGASIRAGAQFCPQCGGSLSESSSPASETPDVSDAAKVKSTERSLPSIPTTFNKELEELPLSGKKNGEDQVAYAKKGAAGVVATEAVDATDVSLTKRQRMKGAARNIVADNVMPRVEKLRRASTVVLEEASAIDPSFRFVLIALLLFVVFIVLLLLSFIK